MGWHIQLSVKIWVCLSIDKMRNEARTYTLSSLAGPFFVMFSNGACFLIHTMWHCRNYFKLFCWWPQEGHKQQQKLRSRNKYMWKRYGWESIAVVKEHYVNWNANLMCRRMTNAINRYPVAVLWFDYKNTHISFIFPFRLERHLLFLKEEMFPRMHPADAIYSSYLRGQNWVTWPNLST